VLFHFLLSRAQLGDQASEGGGAWESVPLACPLTLERLVEPVRLALAGSSLDVSRVFERAAALHRVALGLGQFAYVSEEQLLPCARTAALLLANPHGLVARTWRDPCAGTRRRPSLEWDWAALHSAAADAAALSLTGSRPGAVLRLVPALELPHAPTPCPTRQALGLVVVLVGRGKDVQRNHLVFEPLRGEEVRPILSLYIYVCIYRYI